MLEIALVRYRLCFRQSQSSVRPERTVPAVRQARQPGLPLQRQPAAHQPALGEGRLPVRPLQRARRLLQQERESTVQPGPYLLHPLVMLHFLRS